MIAAVRGEAEKRGGKRRTRGQIECDEKLLITAESLNILRRCIFHIVTICVHSSDPKVKSQEFCNNLRSFSHPPKKPSKIRSGYFTLLRTLTVKV